MQYQHLTFRFLINCISFLGIAATGTLIFLATSGIATAADNLAGLTGGLPALTSTEFGDGSTSYSLSLQVLALMTALTIAITGLGHDLFHSDNHCSVNFTTGNGHAADAT